MAISRHITTFAGRPVAAFPPEGPIDHDPGEVAWRIEDPDFEGGDVFVERLNDLAAREWAGQVKALIIGEWGSAYDRSPPIEVIVAAAARLTSLEALFLGEMTYEECEISWINQTDVTPILQAWPGLQTLTVRGTEGLELKPLRHEGLRSLTIESGGLPAEIVQAVAECDLPSLRHLELWMGTDNYGGDATVEDLAPIMAGGRLPELKSLGLRNAEIADQVALALAGAPVVARLEELDMSLGLLSDVGAAALLTGQPLTHLRKLDLHHHFLSEPVMSRLREELEAAGVEVNLDDAGDPDENNEDRFIAVSE